MKLSPDAETLFWLGSVPVNKTIAFTWVVMIILIMGSYLITRRLRHEIKPSRWQILLETLVTGLNDQIRSTSRQDPGAYLPFIGTLFLLIAVSNLLAVIPGFTPPTASLSTTTALALAVLGAVPLYGISRRGLLAYLADYFKPTVFMLPFNIIGEISRTLALAVRLYGNMMSGTVIGAILLTIVPFFFPIVFQLLGLITGLVQAYIFAVLAMVYIASAQAIQNSPKSDDSSGDKT